MLKAKVQIEHNTRKVKSALNNTDAKVYWRNSLLNTNWQVIDAKTRNGQFQVRVAHPIFAGWYAVAATDTVEAQYREG
jgi:hypothetical protein